MTSQAESSLQRQDMSWHWNQIMARAREAEVQKAGSPISNLQFGPNPSERHHLTMPHVHLIPFKVDVNESAVWWADVCTIAITNDDPKYEKLAAALQCRHGDGPLLLELIEERFALHGRTLSEYRHFLTDELYDLAPEPRSIDGDMSGIDGGTFSSINNYIEFLRSGLEKSVQPKHGGWQHIVARLGGDAGEYKIRMLFGKTFCFIGPDKNSQRVVAIPVHSTGVPNPKATKGDPWEVTWEFYNIDHGRTITTSPDLHRLALQKQQTVSQYQQAWSPVPYHIMILAPSTTHHVRGTPVGFPQVKEWSDFHKSDVSREKIPTWVKKYLPKHQTRILKDHVGYIGDEDKNRHIALVPHYKYEQSPHLYFVWAKLDLLKTEFPGIRKKNLDEFLAQNAKVESSDLFKNDEKPAEPGTNYVVRTTHWVRLPEWKPSSLEKMWCSWSHMLPFQRERRQTPGSPGHSSISYLHAVNGDLDEGFLVPVELWPIGEEEGSPGSTHRLTARWHFLPLTRRKTRETEDDDVMRFFAEHEEGRKLEKAVSWFELERRLVAEKKKNDIFEVMAMDETFHEIHWTSYADGELWAHSDIVEREEQRALLSQDA